jgi:tight adherence protein B
MYAAIGDRLSRTYLLRYRSRVVGDDQVRVRVDVAAGGSSVATYSVPHERAAAPFHRGAGERFWSSPASVAAVALLGAALAFAVVSLLVRARRSDLRERIAYFVGSPVEEPTRRRSFLTGRLLKRTESSLSRTRWWARFAEELEIAEIETGPEKIVLGSVVGALLAGVVLALISPVFCLFALAVPLGARAYCKRRLKKIRDAFAEQLPDNLQVLASALRAGHSFVGALSIVAADTDEPSRREFQRVVADEQLGVAIEDSLREVARRMASSDLDQVALVAELQRQTGGNMAEVLDRVVGTLRDRFDLRRLVKTLTAQGRMARWIVSLLPVFLLGAISVLNPSYVAPLFSTTGGQVALAGAAALVITGSFVIKRIVDIKV